MLYNMLGRGPPPDSPRATYHRKPLPPRDVGAEKITRNLAPGHPWFTRNGPFSEAWLVPTR
jgi:hypothetical protein